MTQIEVRPWTDLPISPSADVHYCGGLRVMPNGDALLYLNESRPRHRGGFCENTDNLMAYAADVLAQFEVQGPTTGWDRLSDGSHITALTTWEEVGGLGLPAQQAPPLP